MILRNSPVSLRRTVTKATAGVELGHAHNTSDKLTMHGMHHGLRPVMCSQLVVDVVEMVAECLQADPKFSGDFGRILTI